MISKHSQYFCSISLPLSWGHFVEKMLVDTMSWSEIYFDSLSIRRTLASRLLPLQRLFSELFTPNFLFKCFSPNSIRSKTAQWMLSSCFFQSLSDLWSHDFVYLINPQPTGVRPAHPDSMRILSFVLTCIDKC